MFTENSYNNQQFIDWFRLASPYIHAHRGRTFVISFGGEALQSTDFANLTHDIALLSSLGVRLVLVHGIRPQIEQYLQLYNASTQYKEDLRITDETALQCVKAACGEVSTNVIAHLSVGLTNSPSLQAQINIVSGNFITARPLGVIDGTDYCYTGEVRRVNAVAIKHHLDNGAIVLISPIGYSPTGEAFNLLTENVATEVAIALRAAKWICLSETEYLLDEQAQLIRQLTVLEAKKLLTQLNIAKENNQSLNDQYRQLSNAVRACQGGVQRVHLINRNIGGGLLLELFSRDGIGTLVSVDAFEHIRKATIEDIGGLLELMEPLETAGILVRRSREKLEVEIDHFTLQERDGMIISCAALYPFLAEKMAELACFIVHSHYRGENRGDILLAFLEREAQQMGIQQIFVLTTHTAHWFQERGFVQTNIDALPVTRRNLYNYQRKSKVFIKKLLY